MAGESGIVGIHEKPVTPSATLADYFIVVIDGAVRRAKIETIIDALAEAQGEGIFDAILRAEEIMDRIDAFSGGLDFKVLIEENSGKTGYDLVMRKNDGTEISRSAIPDDMIGGGGGSSIAIGNTAPTEGPTLWFDTGATVRPAVE